MNLCQYLAPAWRLRCSAGERRRRNEPESKIFDPWGASRLGAACPASWVECRGEREVSEEVGKEG